MIEQNTALKAINKIHDPKRRLILFKALLTHIPGVLLDRHSLESNPISLVASAICGAKQDILTIRADVLTVTRKCLPQVKDLLNVKPDTEEESRKLKKWEREMTTYVWFDHFLPKSILFTPEEIRALRNRVITKSSDNDIRALDELTLDRKVLHLKIRDLSIKPRM